MPSPPCSTPLHDTLERAACRVAQTEALLRRAAATRTLAWAALERSQHLLAQLERSQAGDLPDPMRAQSRSPSPSTPEQRHALDV